MKSGTVGRREPYLGQGEGGLVVAGADRMEASKVEAGGGGR